MYRRIELIFQQGDKICGIDKPLSSSWKQGLMGISPAEIVDAWIDRLSGPGRQIPDNSRFYFTERGWKDVGRFVVEACQRSGQKYRVMAIKENSVNVVFRDLREVAVQPIRAHRKSGYVRRRKNNILQFED